MPSQTKTPHALRRAGCVVNFDPSADHDAHGIAPLAHLRVAQAIDGFVCPLGRRGGEELVVHVTRRGVEGQRHVTGAAVHMDFLLLAGQRSCGTQERFLQHGYVLFIEMTL